MLIMCILAIRGLNVFRKLLKGGTKRSKKNNAVVFKSVCIQITTGNCEVLRFGKIPSQPPSLIPSGWAGARESVCLIASPGDLTGVLGPGGWTRWCRGKVLEICPHQLLNCIQGPKTVKALPTEFPWERMAMKTECSSI